MGTPVVIRLEGVLTRLRLPCACHPTHWGASLRFRARRTSCPPCFRFASRLASESSRGPPSLGCRDGDPAASRPSGPMPRCACMGRSASRRSNLSPFGARRVNGPSALRARRGAGRPPENASIHRAFRHGEGSRASCSRDESRRSERSARRRTDARLGAAAARKRRSRARQSTGRRDAVPRVRGARSGSDAAAATERSPPEPALRWNRRISRDRRGRRRRRGARGTGRGPCGRGRRCAARPRSRSAGARGAARSAGRARPALPRAA